MSIKNRPKAAIYLQVGLVQVIIAHLLFGRVDWVHYRLFTCHEIGGDVAPDDQRRISEGVLKAHVLSSCERDGLTP